MFILFEARPQGVRYQRISTQILVRSLGTLDHLLLIVSFNTAWNKPSLIMVYIF